MISSARWSPLVLSLAMATALFSATARSQDQGKKRPEAPLPTDATSPLVEVVKPQPGGTLGAVDRVEIVAKVTDDSGRLKTVTINGTAVSPRADGLYAQTVAVHLGANKVVIEATDLADNSATVRLQFRSQAPPAVKGNVQIKFAGKVDDPKAKVTVNGKPVAVNEDGSFECLVVPDAQGKITVVAVDEFGNESHQVHDLQGH